jgi:hypothetical protein
VRAWLSSAEAPSVHLGDGHDLVHRACEEHLIGHVDVCGRDVLLGRCEAELRRDLHAARQSRHYGIALRRHETPAAYDEDVGRIRLCQEALHIQHQCLVCAGLVGLHLRHDLTELVAGMQLRVESLGRSPPHARCGEANAALRPRRLLGLHDYDDRRGCLGTDARVHSGRGRIAARDRDADMGILGQAVGAHGIEDGARHGFAAEK